MTEPSPQLHQHHAIEPPAIDYATFRVFWRIRTRLDTLLLDGAISFAVWRAGVAFRTAAEIVIRETWRSRMHETRVADVRTPAIAATMSVHRVDAANQLRAIRQALGDFAIDLLEMHLVEDVAWSELGRRCGVHSKTARNWTIAALQGLAAL
jgi:hypothetical protein